MVLEKQSDHLKEVLQEDAVPIVEHVGEEGLEEHGKEKEDAIHGGLRIHQQHHGNHVVHSLPVRHIILRAVGRNDRG